MSHDVGHGIRAIIASFVDGLDVTTSLHQRPKHKKQHRNRPDSDATATNALSRSLRRSPKVIRQEYETALRHAGPNFARGDGIAVSRLNEILLRLNCGLVNIIASFLNRNSYHDPSLDYASLTALSDTSRRDSIGVLHQLYQRVTSARLPIKLSAREEPSARRQGRSGKSAAQMTRIYGPIIAQVTIEDSSRPSQLAIVKPAANSKRKDLAGSRQHLPTQSPNASSATLINSSKLSLSSRRPEQQSRRAAVNTKLGKQAAHVESRAQSRGLQFTIKPSSQSQSNLLASSQPAWPHNALISPNNPRAPTPPKRITPTLYSIATDSTKLGEVPMHKCAASYDHEASAPLNAEAMQKGWPARDIDGVLLVRPKKRFNWFGLRRQHIAIH